MSLWKLRKGRINMNKWNNPVLMKEMKLRFRSFKSFSGLLFYLAVLTICVAGFIAINSVSGNGGYFLPEMSYILFITLSVVQMGLVMFITPGVTAGVISSEREKQTLNMLLTTTQSSTQIILGKLSSSIAFIVLMLFAGLPLYSIVFLFGGVSPSELFLTFLYYLLTLIAIGSIGVFFSTVTKRTIVSMIATYGTMIFLGAVSAFLFLVSIQVGHMYQTNVVAYLFAAINPGALVLTLTSSDLGYGFAEMTGIDLPLWIPYLIIHSAITVGCLLGAIKRLRANMKTQR